MTDAQVEHVNGAMAELTTADAVPASPKQQQPKKEKNKKGNAAAAANGSRPLHVPPSLLLSNLTET